jgi:hypothetical protein
MLVYIVAFPEVDVEAAEVTVNVLTSVTVTAYIASRPVPEVTSKNTLSPVVNPCAVMLTVITKSVWLYVPDL